MYCDFFQLRERPFNITADPKFLYLNACYREALASLHYGVTQRKGFITLIGEAGTGKTTLLKRLLEDLDENTRTVFLFNTNVSFDEILEYIFHELDIPVQEGKRLHMLQRLNSFLLDELRAGRNVALLIDEAQDLDYSVMEDLRLLSNLETAKEKILQIVLSGQPELGQKLGNPNLRQLRQRVAINCRLQPLSREELTEYIEARLQAAGAADTRLFTRDAEDRIFQMSHGIPRLVNIVCDNALVIGYALGKKRIGGDVIAEAAADLFSTEPDLAAEPMPPATAPAAAVSSGPKAPTLPSFSVPLGKIASIALAAVAAMLFVVAVIRFFFAEAAPPSTGTVATRRSLEVVQPGLGSAEWSRRERAIEPAGERDSEAGPPRGGPSTVATDDVRDAGTLDRLEPLPERVEPRLEGIGDVTRPSAPETAEGVGRAPVAIEQEESKAVDREDGARNSADDQDDQAEELAMLAPRVVAPATAPAVPPEVPAPVDAEGRRVGGREEGRQPAASPSARVALASAAADVVQARPGDSISGIAIRKYGAANYTVLDLLKLANPDVRDIDRISAGQTIRLPILEDGLAVLNDSNGGFGLLLVSTPQKDRAEALRQALAARGFRPEIRRADFGGGRQVYRLVLSGMDTREEARSEGNRLKRVLREDDRLAALAR